MAVSSSLRPLTIVGCALFLRDATASRTIDSTIGEAAAAAYSAMVPVVDDKIDEKVYNYDLLQPLDADLDDFSLADSDIDNGGEPALRGLQTFTISPTPAPTAATRDGTTTTAAPTAAVDRGMATGAPTSAKRVSPGIPVDGPVATPAGTITPSSSESSGVWRLLPSAAMAVATVVLVALSGASILA